LLIPANSQTERVSKKNLAMPVKTNDQGEGLYITYKDLDYMKTLIIVQMLAFVIGAVKWIAGAIWSKGQITIDDIKEIKERLIRIEANGVTKEEMHNHVRKEIEYAGRLQSE
jgi:hypothetical protein